MSGVMREELQSLIERYSRSRDSRLFAPLADAYRKSGDVAKAIEILESGLEKFPRYASAHVILGKCFYDTGATERAKAEFRRVLELDAENMVALKFLGDIFFAEDRRTEAADCYRKLLAIDPTNAEAARILKEMEQSFIVKEIDLADTKTVRDERPRELATITLAGIYAAQGYYNKALAIYREVLAREPLNKEAKEMVAKLQSMIDTDESERDRAFDEPSRSIYLGDGSADILTSTAGHGGEGTGAERASPRAGMIAPEDVEGTGEDALHEEEPAAPASETPKKAESPPRDAEPVKVPPENRAATDIEQFREWLRKVKGR